MLGGSSAWALFTFPEPFGGFLRTDARDVPMRAGTQQRWELAGVVSELRCFPVLGRLQNPPFLPCPEVLVLPIRSPGC